MPITALDQARLRQYRHTADPIMLLWPRSAIATATIDVSPSLYPLGELVVASKSANFDTLVLPGMRFEVTDGDDRITTGIIRKATSGSTVYIDGKSLGDPGFAVLQASFLEAGQTLTVYQDWPLWVHISRIVGGDFLKEFDRTYVDEGDSPPPYVNMGDWQHKAIWVTDTTATFEMTAEGHAWAGKTITGYLWTIPSTATLDGGYALTDQTISFTMPAGFGVATCTATDSDSKTWTGVRPVWAWEHVGTERPFSRMWPFQITADNHDLQGRNIHSNHSSRAEFEGLVYPSQAMLFAPQAKYLGASLTSGTGPEIYVGFADQVQLQATHNLTVLDVDWHSPWAVMSKIPMVNQAIVEAASPANWTQVATGLADPNFLVFYVLAYHCPNMLRLFDYYPLDDAAPPRKRSYALGGNSVSAQLAEISALVGGNIGCASSGALHFKRNPSLEEPAFRLALDERMTIGEGDIDGSISVTRQDRTPVGQMTVYGWIIDENDEATAAGAVAPGLSQQGQGIGRPESDALLVADKTELLNKVGCLLAIANNPYQDVGIVMDRNLDVFDPAKDYNSWYRLDIPADKNPLNEALNTRGVVSRVSRVWERDRIQISTGWVFETFGQPGEEIPIDRDGMNGHLRKGVKYDPPDMRLVTFAFANDDAGRLGRTSNLHATIPVWSALQGVIDGSINDICLDPLSPYVTSGFSGGRFGLYAAVTDSGLFQIWYCEDALGATPSWDLQAQYTMNDSTCQSSARIVYSDSEPGLIAAAWRDRVGTYVVWTSDGSTWSVSATKVDADTSSDTNNDDAEFGLYVYGSITITTGRDSSGKYRVYATDTPDTSFSEVDGQTAGTEGTSPNPMIMVADGLLWVSSLSAGVGAVVESYPFDADVEGWFFEGPGGVWDGSYGNPAGCCESHAVEDPPLSSLYYADIGMSRTLDSTYVLSNVQADFTIYDAEVSGDELHVTVNAYDEQGGDLLGTSTTIVTDLSSFVYPAWDTVSVPFSTPVPGVGFLEISARWGVLPAQVPYQMSIDNVEITELVYTVTLWRVTGWTSTATWDNVSPAADRGPTYPWGLASDPVYPGRLLLLAQDGARSANNLYATVDDADNWTDWGAVDGAFHNLAVLGDLVVSWGRWAINVTESGPDGVPGDPHIGDYGAKVGGPGNFRNVIVIL